MKSDSLPIKDSSRDYVVMFPSQQKRKMLFMVGSTAALRAKSFDLVRLNAVFGMIMHQDRSLSTKSNTRAFKDIEVNGKILNHVRAVGVGFPPRKSRRSRLTRHPLVESGRSRGKRKYASEEEKRISWKPPLPFGPKAYPVKVVKTVTSSNDTFPATTKDYAEIAMVGRSNVGKSTLLNLLLYSNRKEPKSERSPRGKVPAVKKVPRGIKASMSPKPGETRSVVFYQLEARSERDGIFFDHGLGLVDLPGYGFAYASEEACEEYRQMILHYLLSGRKNLKRMLFLIDARHGLKKADIDFLHDLQSHRKRLPPIQVVLTKCDLVKQTDLARRIVQVRDQMSDTLVRQAGNLPIMMVSSRQGMQVSAREQGQSSGGILQLQKELAALVVATPRAPK